MERKRGSDRDVGELTAQAEFLKVHAETRAAQQKRPPRSLIERQNHCLIFLGCLNVCLTILIVLRIFGILA